MAGQHNAMSLAPVLHTVDEAGPETLGQKGSADHRIVVRIAAQTGGQILLQVATGQLPVILLQPIVVSHAETASLGRRTKVPDLRLVGENAPDQGAEPPFQTSVVAFVRQREKTVDRRRVHQVRVVGVAPHFDADGAPLANRTEVPRRKTGIGTGDLTGAVATGPVEFIVKPERPETQRLGLLANHLHRVQKLLRQVVEFAAAAGIDQILLTARLTVSGKDGVDLRSIGTTGQSTHRDQRILSVHTVERRRKDC